MVATERVRRKFRMIGWLVGWLVGWCGLWSSSRAFSGSGLLKLVSCRKAVEVRGDLPGLRRDEADRLPECCEKEDVLSSYLLS